jgi:hypothetical protein
MLLLTFTRKAAKLVTSILIVSALRIPGDTTPSHFFITEERAKISLLQTL